MILRRYISEKTLLCVITLTILAACATVTPPIVQKDINKIIPPSKTSEKADAILSLISERNSTVEDHAEWIERSYKVFNIRGLDTVAETEYQGYSKYLDEGIVYIIVHPAYFPFFHYPKLLAGSDEDKGNVVERFISKTPQDIRFSVFHAQERRMRDFLEYKSTEERLIILILPRNHFKANTYIYRNGPDEYLRYLNEVTNGSKSVLYIESRSSNSGYLKEEDELRLMEFLLSVNPKKVLIGGGYVGRCLEEFYLGITENFMKDTVFIVPELSDISPKELSNDMAGRLLMSDGSINKEVATKNLEVGVYSSQEVRPKIINLP